MNEWIANSKYAEFDAECVAAAGDKFSEFRRMPTISMVVSGFCPAHRNGILNVLMSKLKCVEVQRYVQIASQLDPIGSPVVHGPLSTEFSRYVLVLNQIFECFGALDGMKIVEIGGGFGGLAALICKEFHVASYVILDRPAALGLQKRFLEAAAVRVDCLETDDYEIQQHDLCISTWALTELSHETQALYAGAELAGSRRGYIQSSNYDDLEAKRLGAAAGHAIQVWENNEAIRWFHRAMLWGHDHAPEREALLRE